MSRRVYHPDMRALVLASLSWAAATAAPPAWAQGMATADRLQGPGWWPTKGTAPRAEYVGSAACARCHRQLGTSQAATPMAHTEAPAALSPVFRDHPTLEFHLGPYSYRVDTHDGKSVYTVADGAQSVSAPLGWAFGAGRVGQSYLFERDGKICFGCHTTAAATSDTLDLARLVDGITCEVCHRPGARHVAAIEHDRVSEARQATLNPRTLDPAASVDFCGACHSTWWDVTLAHKTGIAALRSQPYRL